MVQEHCRKSYLPVSATRRTQCISLAALPVIEVTDEIDLVGIGSPFAEHPVALSILVETIVDMIIHSLAQGSVA